jgi:hypothetical protein
MSHSTSVLCLLLEAAAIAGDWPTFGHDPQRTAGGFKRRTLTAANVSSLELKIGFQLDHQAFQLASHQRPYFRREGDSAQGRRRRANDRADSGASLDLREISRFPIL